MEPKVRRLTNIYSGVSAVAAFVTSPVPGLDEIIVVPIHYRLAKRFAKLHGIDRQALPWPQIRKIIWYGALARMGGSFAIGLVPVIGMFSNAITAIALTEFLAQWLDDALLHPEREQPEITMAAMKRLFEDAVRRYGERRAAKAAGAA